MVKSKIRETALYVVFVPTARWIDCGQIPFVTMIRNMEPLSIPFGGNSLLGAFKNVDRAYSAKKAFKEEILRVYSENVA